MACIIVSLKLGEANLSLSWSEVDPENVHTCRNPKVMLMLRATLREPMLWKIDCDSKVEVPGVPTFQFDSKAASQRLFFLNQECTLSINMS